MQEPWDFEAFVALYDARAEAAGGWRYDGDVGEATLRARYLASPETYPTLDAFAEGLFIWEQRLDL
jgi:hypothetical protein